jgi:uncharacterized membrane protein
LRRKARADAKLANRVIRYNHPSLLNRNAEDAVEEPVKIKGATTKPNLIFWAIMSIVLVSTIVMSNCKKFTDVDS